MTEKKYGILASEELGYSMDRAAAEVTHNKIRHTVKGERHKSHRVWDTELSPVKHPQGWGLTNGPQPPASAYQQTECQCFLNYSRNSES